MTAGTRVGWHAPAADRSPDATADAAAVAGSGHLKDADREALAVAMHVQSSACVHVTAFNGCERWAEALRPTVEAIVARAVNEALTEAAEVLELSPSLRGKHRDAAAIIRARRT